MAIDLALPLPLRPRLDPKPWGGHGLTAFGFDLPPDEPIGEALLTAAEAVVETGPHAGRTLGELTAGAPEQMIGRLGLRATGGRPLFPLLIKLIEATSHLSIQVHPDDVAAAAREGDKLGKSEAWHVLAARPGAELYLGLLPGTDSERFAAEVRAGARVAHRMRRLPPRPGTTVLIPAGTIHALGAGTVVYEVQQPSDITYRLDDWGRVDAAGRSRPLHLEQGLAVADAELRPSPTPPVELYSASGRRHLLVACRYFALERIALPSGGQIETAASASPQALTCLRGAVTVAAGAGAAMLGAGGTSVVPAQATPAHLAASAPAVVLRAWVPDLPMEVVAPARRSGATLDAITALGGETGDIVVSAEAG